VHDGSEAQQSAAAAGLAGYTVGGDIVLGQRAFSSPLVHDAVLAHELVHAAQQADAVRAGDRMEHMPPRGDASAEVDAANATPATFAALAGRPGPVAGRRSLRTGLRLHGCPEEEVAEMQAGIGAQAKITALEQQKGALESVTAGGSGRTFGEVGSAYAQLTDVEHDLAVAKTGQGVYKGQKSGDTSSAKTTDCTEIVFEVLRKTFAQQGRSADWAKVEATYRKNTGKRGETTGSGIDLQAALQSQLGWKGIYWAPDPTFAYQDADVTGVKGTEASFALGKAKKGTYYKDFGKKGYPGVRIHHRVTDYAPEPGSTTAKNDAGLAKLKKLPFGVMSAHGGRHMTIFTYGRVIEVHWKSPATSPDVVAQEPLETWATGPKSGIHYFASGAIVAPAADVDAAFR
jgi:hypothetical protein